MHGGGDGRGALLDRCVYKHTRAYTNAHVCTQMRPSRTVTGGPREGKPGSGTRGRDSRRKIGREGDGKTSANRHVAERARRRSSRTTRRRFIRRDERTRNKPPPPLPPPPSAHVARLISNRVLAHPSRAPLSRECVFNTGKTAHVLAV